MAYGDALDFKPGPVKYANYSDGTVIPRMEIQVYRNGGHIGEIDLHLHRTKESPHVSLGLTSRLRSD